MSIWVNDKPFDFERQQTLGEWIEKTGPKNTVFAVTHNHIFVPRKNYSTTVVLDEDKIYYVVPMQGG